MTHGSFGPVNGPLEASVVSWTTCPTDVRVVRGDRNWRLLFSPVVVPACVSAFVRTYGGGGTVLDQTRLYERTTGRLARACASHGLRTVYACETCRKETRRPHRHRHHRAPRGVRARACVGGDHEAPVNRPVPTNRRAVYRHAVDPRVLAHTGPRTHGHESVRVSPRRFRARVVVGGRGTRSARSVGQRHVGECARVREDLTVLSTKHARVACSRSLARPPARRMKGKLPTPRRRAIPGTRDLARVTNSRPTGSVSLSTAPVAVRFSTTCWRWWLSVVRATPGSCVIAALATHAHRPPRMTRSPLPLPDPRSRVGGARRRARPRPVVRSFTVSCRVRASAGRTWKENDTRPRSDRRRARGDERTSPRRASGF